MLSLIFQRSFRTIQTSSSCNFSSISKKLDLSKVPKLNEKELEEQFVRGDGPGGQAVATTNNCVVLKHKITNIVVRCHETRSLQQNRVEARRLLIAKLDELYNKENSVVNQRKRLEQVKYNKNQSKSEKLRKMKLDAKEKNALETNID